MIFKYFVYNAKGTLIDNKIYISLCINNNTDIFQIKQMSYIALSTRNLISIPYEQYSVTNQSTAKSRSYNMNHIHNNGRNYLGKLFQLPDKEKPNTLLTRKIKPVIPSFAELAVAYQWAGNNINPINIRPF